MKLKQILEQIQEKHDLSGAPDEFEVPNVNPSDPKYKDPNEVGIDRNFLDVGHEGWKAGQYDKTASAMALIDVDRAKQFSGKAGENRSWYQRDSGWWFGNFPLEDEKITSWQEFVDSIADRGLDWPITITVEKNGDVFLYEGNHRLAVYDLLDIPQIPANIWWFGNVQGTERDPLRDIFFDVFGKDDYFWLDEE